MTEFFPDIGTAVRLSLQVGFWCTMIGLPVAMPLGWLLARKQFAGKSVLSTLCLTPVVLPPVVTGFLLLRLFSPQSLPGRILAGWGLEIPFSFAGAVLAALVVGLPFYIMGTRAAFEAVDKRLEDLAMSLGFTPARIFFKVTLPLALPGIAGGAVLAFARALGEFGATVVIAGNMEGSTRTIALAIYALLESPRGEPMIMKLVLISIGIAFVTLIAFEALVRWQRRRLEV
jgi:molybdate transport system permease protein